MHWRCAVTTVTTILCWLNASRVTEGAKSTKLWLSPVNPTPLMPEGTSVFVNLPTRAGQKRLADILRANFGVVSYQLLLDMATVTKSPNGFLTVSMDFATMKAALTELEVAPEAPTDPSEDDFFASFTVKDAPVADITLDDGAAF